MHALDVLTVLKGKFNLVISLWLLTPNSIVALMQLQPDSQGQHCTIYSFQNLTAALQSFV